MTATEFEPARIAANGVDFAYLEAGQGPLVLCLHGFPDTAWSFVPLLGRLAEAGYRGVSVFMRGYAPSGFAPDGDYSIPALARDVIALTEHLGGGQAALVGHDWGGIAAYAAAAARPDRFSRLLAAGVPHPRRFLHRPSLTQLRRSSYMAAFQFPVLAERALARNNFELLDRGIRRASPSWRPDAQILAPIHSNFRDPARITAALSYYRALRRGLFDGRAAQVGPIAIPTRVVYGLQDGAVGAEMFRDQRHLFTAGVELCPMSGVGHFMHMERANGFADLVLEFLQAA